MNTFGIFVTAEAEDNIAEAYDWYECQRLGLGEEFVLCLEAIVEQIRENPGQYAKIHHEVRRALMRRFPYGVFYILHDEKIIVVAVFHVRRNPERWKYRANEK